MTDMWDRGVKKVVSMDGDGQWIWDDENIKETDNFKQVPTQV